MTTDHPRPMLARAEWRVLDGPWQYAVDVDGRGVAEGWPTARAPFGRTIQVPFPPESPLSGVNEEPDGDVWYRTEIEQAVPTGDRRLVLHLDGVDYIADVWVNGAHVLSHEGGFTPMSVDITDVLSPDGSQTLVVRAQDRFDDLEQPRGKQDWQHEPHAIWYGRTTGIWRSVWTETVSAVHVTSVRWTPMPEPGVVEAEVRVSGSSAGSTVALDFRSGSALLGSFVLTIAAGVVRARIHLDDPRLHTEPAELCWTPEHPNLIDVRVKVTTGTEVVDVVDSYLGLRTVGVDETDFLLNGQPYYLRLVLEQGYWPESHLAARSDEVLRREVELVKALGFNGVRMHQTTPHPRFLYWCDRLGLLVWVDSAANYRFSSKSFARMVREWIEMVERDINNPSIAAWVPFNESWGVSRLEDDAAQRDAVRGLYHLVRALDPSRPVFGNDGWEYVTGDIVGVHDYSHDPTHFARRYGEPRAISATLDGGRVSGRRIVVPDPGALEAAKRRPVVLTEFGGLNLGNAEGTWAGYGSVANGNEYLAKLRSLFDGIRAARGLVGFCYTQLTDTAQERNGLLTETREPKVDQGAIYRIVTGQPETEETPAVRATPGFAVTREQHADGPSNTYPVNARK